MDCFLNGNLEVLHGPTREGAEHLVCELKKSIYGLKQSPCCWNTALDKHVKSIGFAQSNCNTCIYYKHVGEQVFYMGVYVDDIILAA